MSEAEDQYNGHCETCAVCFTGEVVKLLCSNVKYQPSDLLHAAYVSLDEKLTNLSWEECVVEIFAAEQRARKDKKNEHMSPTKGRIVAMWEPLITHDVFAGENFPLCSSIVESGGVQDTDACHIMDGFYGGLTWSCLADSFRMQRCRKLGPSCCHASLHIKLCALLLYLFLSLLLCRSCYY
jgi:hypothetical protein